MSGKYDVDITEMGIYLFRNQVGFLWYEITVPNKMSAEELIEVQYFIKEQFLMTVRPLLSLY